MFPYTLLVDVKKFSRDTLLNFCGRAIIAVSMLLANIIIARTVGPEGKGIAEIVFLYPFIAYQILSLGLEPASAYYVCRRRDYLPSLAGNLFVHTLLACILFYIFSIFASKWIINSFFKTDIFSIFLISILIFPFLTILNVTSFLFLGLRDFKKFNLLFVSKSLLRFPFAFIFLVILKKGFLGCAYFNVLSVFCAFTLAIILLLNNINDKININFSLYKKSLLYGIKSQIGVIITQFNMRLGYFFITSYRSLQDLGIYSIGVLAAEVLWFLPDSLARSFFPRVISFDHKAETRKNSEIVISTTTWILVLLSVAIILLGKPLIIFFFGPKFMKSFEIILILLPGTVMVGIAKISSSVFHGIGKPEFGTYLASLGIVTTILLDILLIPSIGIKGAAIASSIAYCIMGSSALIFLTQLVGGKIWDYILPKPRMVINLAKNFWKG